jgi:hypothetical protein
MCDRRPRVVPPHLVASYSYAFLLVSALSYAVYITPLNVNDLLKHLFLFETQSISETFHREFFKPPGAGDWRPLQLPTAQVIYEFLARGHEHLVFKGMLIGSLFLTVGLFVHVLKIRSWTDVPAAAIALLVLLGHHSFGGAVEGVYPYGVEIILLACEFAILMILLRPRPSLAGEILALAISIFAILLNEKGGFVGVSYIVGSLLRLPGGTLRSAALVFAACAAVAWYHLWVTPLGALMARNEAQGYREVVFDAVAPILNILISDPRLGEFATIPLAVEGKPWAIVYVTSSLFLSALILVWAWSTSRQAEDSRRQELKIAAIFLVVLLGSAMFGPFSRKDYMPIMALGGYALVSFYALRWLFAKTLHAERPAVHGALVMLSASLALGWSIRAAGLEYHMRHLAFAYQKEWAFHVDLLGRTHKFDASITQPIIARLRPEGLSKPLNDPHLVWPKLIARFMLGRDCPEICRSPKAFTR